MSSIVLFDDGTHKNVLLENFDAGAGVECNQHVVVHGGEAMILDPGGSKVYRQVFTASAKAHKGAKLRYVFCSHQDPDIVAALNGWMMTTQAEALCSSLWKRFIPHFGSDRLVYERVTGIPDEGQRLNLGGTDLLIIPAHYLHSCGNFHLYDPVSKILYSGDMGVALGRDYRVVPDFAAHVPFMVDFHKRYMSGNTAMRAWVKMVRQLDIEIIAPQHGALFQGKEMVGQVLDWFENLECGVDAYPNMFTLPA